MNNNNNMQAPGRNGDFLPGVETADVAAAFMGVLAAGVSTFSFKDEDRSEDIVYNTAGNAISVNFLWIFFSCQPLVLKIL
jgi:hypothetical protein